MPLSAGERRLLVAAALVAACACALLKWAVFANIPHGWDAIAYVFQAKVFASGRLAAPGVPLPDSFWMEHIVSEPGRRFAIYPPGWPLVLAPFAAAGAAHLASAALAGVALLLAALLARRLFGVSEMWLTVGLLLASPFFVFMGTSDFAHLPCATALLGAAIALLRALDAAPAPPNRGRALDRAHGPDGDRASGPAHRAWSRAAGGAFGLAFLIRPYSALLGGAGVLLVALAAVGAGRRRWLAVIRSAAPFAAIGLLLYAAHNAALTGSPFVSPYSLHAADFSFLGKRGAFRESVWENAAANVPRAVRALATETWGWPLPDLWLFALLPLLRPRDRRAWALVGAAALFIAAQSLYYFFDLAYGPRLVFEALPWVAIGTAAAMTALWRAARARFAARANPAEGSNLPALSNAAGRAAPALLAALLALQSAAGALALYPRLARYYAANYCGQGRELLDAIEKKGLRNAVVFVQTKSNRLFAYGNVYLLNALDARESPVVFVRFSPESVAPVIEAFPRDEHWLLSVDYEDLPTRNVYSDRFRITKLDWNPVRITEANR